MKPGHLLFDKDNICFYQPELRRRDWSGHGMHINSLFRQGLLTLTILIAGKILAFDGFGQI
ncbi:MAG: hypothetical protein RIR48_1852, partial [Bacteroidota bacterium]